MGRRNGREGVDGFTGDDVARLSDSLSMFDEHIRGVNIMKDREIVEDEGEDLEVDDAGEIDADDSECGPPEEVDMVDHAIEGLMTVLEDAGYSEEDAEEAVYDAISALVDDEKIEDTPDMDNEEEDKALWVKTAVPLIRAKLTEMGLDFSAGA